MLADTPGVRDLSLTTNGVLLDRLAQPLVDAGLRADQRLPRLARPRSLRRVHAARRARRRCSAASRRPSVTRASSRSRSTASRSRASPRKTFRDFAAARTSQAVRRPLHRVHAARRGRSWRDDQVLTGGEIRALIEAEHGPLVELPAKASSTARALRLRRRHRRVGFVNPVSEPFCSHVRPHPPDRRRPAPNLPLLPPRVGPEDAAPRGGKRRRADGAPPQRGGAQGAEAPDQRARIRSRFALDEPDRGVGQQPPWTRISGS